MSAHLLDGKTFADEILRHNAAKVAALVRPPGFAAILVGDDPASEMYVRLKEKACLAAGVKFERHALASDVGQVALLSLIAALNDRDEIDAILLQLPLPAGRDYDTDAAIAAIDPSKDVDGFHPDNLARLRSQATLVFSPLVAGIMLLIQNAIGGRPPAEAPRRRALVIANSPIFYEPLEVTLPWEGFDPSFRRPDDADVAETARAADAVIVAVGRTGFLKADMVKPGAIIIDVGTNRVEREGKTITVGDADPGVAEVAGHLTPVPGGVGPMTVAMVVTNAITLAEHRQK